MLCCSLPGLVTQNIDHAAGNRSLEGAGPTTAHSTPVGDVRLSQVRVEKEQAGECDFENHAHVVCVYAWPLQKGNQQVDFLLVLQEEAFGQLQGFVDNTLTPMSKQLKSPEDVKHSKELHVLLAK